MWGLLKMSLLQELGKAVLLIGTLARRRQSGAVGICGGFPAKLENGFAELSLLALATSDISMATTDTQGKDWVIGFL